VDQDGALRSKAAAKTSRPSASCYRTWRKRENAFNAAGVIEAYAENAVFTSFGKLYVEGRTALSNLWTSMLTYHDGQAARTAKSVSGGI